MEEIENDATEDELYWIDENMFVEINNRCLGVTGNP